MIEAAAMPIASLLSLLPQIPGERPEVGGNLPEFGELLANRLENAPGGVAAAPPENIAPEAISLHPAAKPGGKATGKTDGNPLPETIPMAPSPADPDIAPAPLAAPVRAAPVPGNRANRGEAAGQLVPAETGADTESEDSGKASDAEPKPGPGAPASSPGDLAIPSVAVQLQPETRQQPPEARRPLPEAQLSMPEARQLAPGNLPHESSPSRPRAVTDPVPGRPVQRDRAMAKPGAIESAPAPDAKPAVLAKPAPTQAARVIARDADPVAESDPTDAGAPAEAILPAPATLPAPPPSPEAAPLALVPVPVAVPAPAPISIPASALASSRTAAPAPAPISIAAAAPTGPVIQAPVRLAPPVAPASPPPGPRMAPEAKDARPPVAIVPAVVIADLLQPETPAQPGAPPSPPSASPAPSPAPAATIAALPAQPLSGATGAPIIVARGPERAPSDPKSPAPSRPADPQQIEVSPRETSPDIQRIAGASEAWRPAHAAPQLIPSQTVAPTAASEAPRPFAELIDRLVEAREAARTTMPPQPVHASLSHADFGKVTLRFEQDGAGLNVAMASPDPDFARAVQAAMPAAPANSEPQSRFDPPGSQLSGGAFAQSQPQSQPQSQSQTQPRTQSPEPRQPEPRARPDADPQGRSDDRPGRRNGIFA